MGKILSKARQLRFEYQVKAGRTVTAQEVAKELGIHKNTMSQIERGQTEGIAFDTLAKLCAFYGVEVGAILQYVGDEIQKNGKPEQLTFA